MALNGAWAPSERWTHRTALTYYDRAFYYGDQFDGIDESQFASYVFDANYRYRRCTTFWHYPVHNCSPITSRNDAATSDNDPGTLIE